MLMTAFAPQPPRYPVLGTGGGEIADAGPSLCFRSGDAPRIFPSRGFAYGGSNLAEHDSKNCEFGRRVRFSPLYAGRGDWREAREGAVDMYEQFSGAAP